jgi:hypothetical protein
MNVAYTAQVAAIGGTSPYTWTSTALPAGLTLNASTGAITGTPTAIVSQAVTFTVTDSTSPTHLSVQQQFTITITSGLVITTTSLPNGVATSPYSATLAASGGVSPLTWSANGLPSGLSINSGTGVIGGTPSAAFNGNVTIMVTDSSSPTNQNANKQFALLINPALTMTTTALPSGVVGVAYAASVTATGGTSPLTYSASGLPSPLTINSGTGAISGTPAAAGTFAVTLTVTDSTSPTNQSVSKPVSLVINPALTITTTALPEGVVNAAYTATVSAANGNGTLTWSASGLPSPLTISPSTGIISGTPTANSTSTVTITVTDSTSPTPQTANKQFTLTIVSNLTITTQSLPAGAVNLAYSTQLAAAGGIRRYHGPRRGSPHP